LVDQIFAFFDKDGDQFAALGVQHHSFWSIFDTFFQVKSFDQLAAIEKLTASFL